MDEPSSQFKFIREIFFIHSVVIHNQMIAHRIQEPDLVISTVVHRVERDDLEVPHQIKCYYKQDKINK